MARDSSRVARCTDTLSSAADRANVITFIESIDARTPPFP